MPTKGLDLQRFSIQTSVVHFTSHHVDKIIAFLETQSNLQELHISASENVHCDFFNRFGEALLRLQNLTSVYLNFSNGFIKTTDENQRYWTLGNLEKIRFFSRNLSHNVIDQIFHFPSEKLKEIVLHGPHNYGDEGFKKILQNYPSLTNWDIAHGGQSSSSNDIFLIMKNAKKLENLVFDFPSGSALDDTKFNGPDDLVLPEIESVEFTLNDLITNENLSKLMQLMTNLKKVIIRAWDDKNFNQLRVEIITRELPHLNSLFYGRFEPNLQELESLRKLVEKHNQRPNEFKFNKKSIQTWIKEAIEKDKQN